MTGERIIFFGVRDHFSPCCQLHISFERTLLYRSASLAFLPWLRRRLRSLPLSLSLPRKTCRSECQSVSWATWDKQSTGKREMHLEKFLANLEDTVNLPPPSTWSSNQTWTSFARNTPGAKESVSNLCWSQRFPCSGRTRCICAVVFSKALVSRLQQWIKRDARLSLQFTWSASGRGPTLPVTCYNAASLRSHSQGFVFPTHNPCPGTLQHSEGHFWPPRHLYYSLLLLSRSYAVWFVQPMPR